MRKVRIKERKMIGGEWSESIIEFIKDMNYIRENHKDNPEFMEEQLNNCRVLYKDLTNNFREDLGINNIISLGVAEHKKTGEQVLTINIWDCDVDQEDNTRWYTIEEDEEGVYIYV